MAREAVEFKPGYGPTALPAIWTALPQHAVLGLAVNDERARTRSTTAPSRLGLPELATGSETRQILGTLTGPLEGVAVLSLWDGLLPSQALRKAKYNRPLLPLSVRASPPTTGLCCAETPGPVDASRQASTPVRRHDTSQLYHWPHGTAAAARQAGGRSHLDGPPVSRWCALIFAI